MGVGMDIRALKQGRTKRIRDQHYGSKGESVIRKEVRGKELFTSVSLSASTIISVASQESSA